MRSQSSPGSATGELRFWTFLDTDNDYGIPEVQKPDFSHADKFKDRQGIKDAKERMLKSQPTRSLYLESNTFEPLLNDSFTKSGTNFTSYEPDFIYDIKQKTGNESTCSQANLGVIYKNSKPLMNYLPADQTTVHVNFNELYPKTTDDNYSWKKNKDLSLWPVTTHAFNASDSHAIPRL